MISIPISFSEIDILEMPPKRSKSKEREHKRKYRELMSVEKKEIEKEKLKERMRKHRGKKSGGEKKETLTSALWALGTRITLWRDRAL